MKRIAVIAVIGGLLVAASTWAAQVTNVEISYQDGFTVARIDVQGAVRFTHQTEVPKDGRPDRVIVDLLSATHELGAKEYLHLPSCVITGIRSSQFAVTPEKITRIVFDLASAPVYRVESDDKSVTVFFREKEPKNFAVWSTSTTGATKKTVEPAKVASQPVITPASEVSSKSVQARNEAIERDRAASLSADATPTAPSASKNEDKSSSSKSEDPGISAPMFSKEWSTAPLDENMPQPSPMEEEFSQVKSDVPTNVESAKPVERVSVPKPTADKEVTKKESAPPPVKAAKKEVASAQPASPPKDQKPAPAPKLTWSPPMLLSEGTPPAGVDKVEVPTATTTGESETVSTQEPVVELASAAVESAEVSPSDFEPAVEMEEAEYGDESEESAPGAARATARFRREVQSDKIRGTMVAEFPKRLVIKYEQAGLRDPFRSLIDVERTFDEPMVNRVPNVEGLKLVGIIDSDGGKNQALFEDKTGFSYILKTGDKVRNGYVLRVEPEQVYFQIFEYGWSRTVALTMD